MFEKITGVKCPPLDFYIIVAIIIHIVIFYMFFSGKMEGFDVEMIEYCDSNPDDPECVELNEVLDYCIEYPDDPDCVDFEVDLFTSMNNAGMNTGLNNVGMNNVGMNNVGMNNVGGPSMMPMILSTLIFSVTYFITYGIFLKLFCKNKMVKSAWFLLLAPVISVIASTSIMLLS